MQELEYLNINGKLVSAKDKIFTGNNRSFLYGDGLFESMHAFGSEIQFVENHFSRLSESAKRLNFDIPSGFNVSMIIRETERMLHKNRHFKGARIRLNLYRNEGGLYTPEQNSVSWVIQGAKLSEEKYVLNKKGLTVGVFEEIPKPRNILSNIKSSNSLIYVLAGAFKNENDFDDVLLINDEREIIEALSSNLFVLKGEIVYTPPINSGPVAGVMRKIIINILDLIGYKVEFIAISENMLLKADEVFLSNAVNGLQWVAGYQSKRYFNLLSYKVVTELNRVAFSD